MTEPSVQDADFYHCIDRLQDRIDESCKIVIFDKIEGVRHEKKYCLTDSKGELVAYGMSIRELLVNLVLVDC